MKMEIPTALTRMLSRCQAGRRSARDLAEDIRIAKAYYGARSNKSKSAISPTIH